MRFVLVPLACGHRVWTLSNDWERYNREGCLNCAAINHGYTEETFVVFLFDSMR